MPESAPFPAELQSALDALVARYSPSLIAYALGISCHSVIVDEQARDLALGCADKLAELETLPL